MTRHSHLPALPLILALAACGGGGGGEIVSAPPPPVAAAAPAPVSTLIQYTDTIAIGAPLAPTPALTAGQYGAIGLVVSPGASGTPIQVRNLAAGDLRIAVDPVTTTYTLAFDPIAFAGLTPPDGRLAYTIDHVTYGRHYTVTRFANGVQESVIGYEGSGGNASRAATATGDPKNTRFASYTGLNHVSLGSWGEWIIPGASAGSSVVFAYGERTPAAAIPITGHATYNFAATEQLAVSLDADFATRAISASIDRDYYNAEVFVPGIHAAGSSVFSAAGDFTIGLAGTYTGDLFDQRLATPLTGSLTGAFFGPGAAQVGGGFVLNTIPHGPISGVFAGTRN